MKTLQKKMKTLDSSHLNEIKKINPNLILAFGSPDFFQNENLKTLATEFKDTKIIGCSTSGEIVSEGIEENSLSLTGVHFDSNVDIREAHAHINSPSDVEGSGEEIGKKLAAENLKFIFVLGLGVNFNGSALIRGIQKHIPKDVILTGGLAGDNGAFQKTFTIQNENISDSSVVAIGFYGEGLEIGYGSIGGWQPFGPVRKITKAEGNILYEIDGASALDMYKKYLNDKADGLPASGLHYPIAILDENNLNSVGLIRTLLNIDEEKGALILAGDIQSGAAIQLMYSRGHSLVEGAQQAAQHAFDMLSDETPENDSLAILISCVGRKLAMGEETEDEVFSIKDVLGPASTLTGFYSYGEIAPFKSVQDCQLHNQTMTVTYIKEKKVA